MALLTPIYLDPADVEAYLLNKIDVGTNLNLQQITPAVLASWVRQGEIQVEKDLYPFYNTNPLQTVTGGSWTTLPPNTYGLLWNLLMTAAQIFILEQQFGRMTNTTGQDYVAYLLSNYKGYLNSFYSKTSNGTYILGQAEALAINKTTSSNLNVLIPAVESHVNMRSQQMEYAIRQINNPPVTWYNGRLYANCFWNHIAGCWCYY